MTSPLAFLPSFITAPDSQALCAEIGGDEWFPEEGGTSNEAKATCHRCELIEPCREWALTHDEEGIWGGLSQNERRAIKQGSPPPRNRAGNWTTEYTRGAILEMLRDNWSAAEVAREYGVSERTVHRIRARAEQEGAAA